VAASLATPFFILFFVLITPVFISPLFNKYEPLTDPALRDPILAMARGNGVPANNVYQFNASKQSKRVSANVSGALGTIRISLNDNLLARCPPEGVMAVMGHEIGHYVLNHVYERTVYLSLVLTGVFWFIHLFAGLVVGRRGAVWGITGTADLAAMPVLFAGLGIALFLTTSISNSITRVSETEADLYGLNSAREPDAMAEVFLMLSEYRKLKPGRLEEILFFTHPSGYNRILAAMRWKAENIGPPAVDSPPRLLLHFTGSREIRKIRKSSSSPSGLTAFL
jgi:STE24 endopeptidase